MAERARDGTEFELTGPSDAPLVTLIHGLGLNRGMWREHVEIISGRYRVLSYDLLGHGRSAPPAEKPTLSLFAEQLRGLLDDVGANMAALVGFSLGGMINRRFALDHPTRVSALAILNSPHERGAEAQRSSRSAPPHPPQADREPRWTPRSSGGSPQRSGRSGRT